MSKGSSSIYNVSYDYDNKGTTELRTSQYYDQNHVLSQTISEDFVYSTEGHSRLTDRVMTVTNAALSNHVSTITESMEYDGFGNITRKTGTVDNIYTYDQTNPYQLNTVTGNRNYSMVYDAHGNITHDGQREFKYSSSDMPLKIEQNGTITEFAYGPDNQRFYRKDSRTENGVATTTETFYAGKVYEQNHKKTGSQSTPSIEHRWYIGPVVITNFESGPGEQYEVLHGDALGSTVAVTRQIEDSQGNKETVLMANYLYDAWGKQSQIMTGFVGTNPIAPAASRRAYTGHENVEGLDIIHMNGRIYDATLARFMQADPFVQAPTNTQSYNRYSYVLNNPLSYTVPSGFISLGKIGKWLRDIADVPVLDAIISVALYVIPGCQGWCTAIYQGLKTTAVTGSLGAGLRAGALSAAMPGGANLGNAALNFVVDGVVGGIFSVLGGGKFGHGFISSYVGNAFAGAGGSNPYARITVSSLIGGTVSSFTGGKFANGAISSAFASTVREFRSGSFNSSETSGGSCSKCGQVSLGNIDDLSYDQLSDIRSGLIDARNAGYDSVSINDALKRINSRIGDIIGIPSFTQSEVLRGVIRDHINSKSEPVFAGLDNAATLAGFCSLPQCSAFSWGVAGVNMLRSGSSSGLISNGIGEMFNRYWSSRIPGGGVYSDLAQGTTGYLIGEGVSSHQEKLKQGN
ncbi:RHS repeat domain-containing protein [Rheinheimera sediminis]|uniref:RHS repeat domain-containing protein n=1 Tax=Rheinheimera sp. YQF-1 TaxID=2499626 RepID=UPI001647BF37|nr:RHS repeat-associated core domain-containing protein [Rheinheimera sp. YQF-1]